MLTCALDANAIVIFFFFTIIIMTKALLYLKQFLKIYNPLALFNMSPTHRRGIEKAHN